MKNTIYNKTFTGEIKPVLINKDTISVSDPTFPNIESYPCQEIPLIKWRDIVIKHLPSNANLETVEVELKLEYLHFDYVVPSRVIIPSSEFPVEERRESELSKQQKLIAFENKYNRTGNYAFEFRLLKLYDSNFRLNSTIPYTNQIAYNAELNYPISDLIYNKNLPGYFDLMPYLVKNNQLMFADIKQELRVQILPKLGIGDLLVFGGGYSGSVYYELKDPEFSVNVSTVINLDGVTPQQLLGMNSNRYGFHLCNNSDNNIYYSFGAISGNSAKLILKPGEVLVQEDKKLTLNNSEINPGDTRYILGFPLWARGTLIGGTQQISIEEISFN